MRTLYVDMIYSLVMRVRQKIFRVTLYACVYHHAGDCVHKKILFLGMNYVTFVFFFFPGECLVSDCGEVRVPRECLT